MSSAKRRSQCVASASGPTLREPLEVGGDGRGFAGALGRPRSGSATARAALRTPGYGAGVRAPRDRPRRHCALLPRGARSAHAASPRRPENPRSGTAHQRSRKRREGLTPRTCEEGGIDDDRNTAAAHDAGEVQEPFIGAIGHGGIVDPGRHGACGLRLGRQTGQPLALDVGADA